MAVEDPTKKQIEEVDPEVAKILGLEDNFDLEYDEYMTLLKERIAKGAFDEKAKLPEDDLAKLANERKRIRDLKESRFTAPKKTVNADSFFGRKKEESSVAQKPITDASKLLPGSGGAIQKYKPPEEQPQEPQEQEKNDGTADKLKEVENFLNGTLLGLVKEIRGLTEGILSVLQKQGAADKKGSELFRRESEKGGKRDKESGLESKEDNKKGEGLIEKVSKPFKSIFDTIINFITMVLLGSAINWLWSVFKNPMMLLKPIQGLIDGITGFFNTVIQFIDSMVVKPVRSFIDTINSALNGFIGLLNTALKMLPGSPQIGQANIPNIPEAPEIQSPDITGEKKEPPAAQPKAAPASPAASPTTPAAQPKVQLNFTGGPITSETPVLKLSNAGPVSKPKGKKEKKNPFDDTASKEGGIVNSKTTAFDVSGLGPDKFLTALSLGEYILKPGAVEWLGGEKYLDGVNKMFGGSSARRTANLGDVTIEAKQGGGLVGGGSPTAKSSGAAHPYLSKMSDGNIKKASAPPGWCVTGSLNTMQKSGVPNPAATGADAGNNPRGAAVQLIKSYGWKSIGGSSSTLKSPYGTVNTGIFSKSQYAKVVDEGKVPSGALIFQTRHADWNGTSPGSSGYDMAIAQKQGRALWNGQPMGQWVYGNTQKVIALTPGGQQGDGSPPSALDSPSPADIASNPPGTAPPGAAAPENTASEGLRPEKSDYENIIRGDPRIGGMGGDPNLRGMGGDPPKKGGGLIDSVPWLRRILGLRDTSQPRPTLNDWRNAAGPGLRSGMYGRYIPGSAQVRIPASSPTRKPQVSSSTSKPTPVVIKQTGDKEKDMAVWAKANPILATALAEKERIRGTAQTDNPLMKDFISKLPLNSPSVQAAEVAKLGKGFQGLSDNKNAFRAPTIKPTSQGAPASPAQPISKPATPLVPSTTSSGTGSGGDLSKMSIEQLTKMLDPTVTGAANPSVFAASQAARIQGKESGLSGEALEKHVLIATIQAKKGGSPTPITPTSIAPSSITSPTQPTIPKPPDTKPNVSMMPLPNVQQGSGVPSTGTVKSGSTPSVNFNSYHAGEHTIITTAAIYNIWGM